ncbi:hypothetical protein NXW64_25940 [Bacteroides ovatus]|nr:hypothetical protein NXW64_25940 [Bacteroides ovatus]
MAAELTYGEKKEVKKVRLPYREPFNQAVTDYRFKIPETGYETTIASAALDSKLELNGGIEKDSFCVSLSNPLQLELSLVCVSRQPPVAERFGKRDGTQIRRDRSLFRLLRRSILFHGG